MKISVNGIGPAEAILQLTPLDAGEGVVQVLGNLADLATADGVLAALVAQLADGRHHGSRTGAPSLLEGAVLQRLMTYIGLRN